MLRRGSGTASDHVTRRVAAEARAPVVVLHRDALFVHVGELRDRNDAVVAYFRVEAIVDRRGGAPVRFRGRKERVQERAFTEPTLVLRVVGESVDTKNKHETNLSFAGARACGKCRVKIVT